MRIEHIKATIPKSAKSVTHIAFEMLSLLWSVDPDYIKVAEIDTLLVEEGCARAPLRPDVVHRAGCTRYHHFCGGHRRS